MIGKTANNSRVTFARRGACMKRSPVQLILGIGLLVLFANAGHAQWVQTNGPYGGDINALAFSGAGIFAGTEGSGVFLSTIKDRKSTRLNSSHVRISYA